MAIVRLTYLEHVHAALQHALAYNPEAMSPLVSGLVDFTTAGPSTISGMPTTRANRQEVVRILVGIMWRTVLGRAYDAHGMRHLLLEASVPYEQTEDVPDVREPLL